MIHIELMNVISARSKSYSFQLDFFTKKPPKIHIVILLSTVQLLNNIMAATNDGNCT